ncbi:bifunctional diguanylate cyclase/phosphodiesterase [Photobacterium nomapromontoriensis]|uniref:bifunctional diguanylate cyclase/phosphodiesterase n=1 Tax=Photobacterium nomapromontoriensis TaxID=2910237 RepID=UPI003D0DFFCC
MSQLIGLGSKTSSVMENTGLADLKRLSGSKLFEAITRLLYEVFNAEHVFIGYFSENNQSVHTLSYRLRGNLSDNFTYSLIDTPCENVRQTGQICYHDQVQQHYPDDEALKAKQVESYIGVPVFAQDAQPEGIIVCLFRQPFLLSEQLLHLCQELSYYLGVELKYSTLLQRQDKLLWELEEGQRVAKVGSWFWNLSNNQFEWSREVYRIYGIQDDSISPTISMLSSLIHPEDREWVLKTLYSAVESDLSNYNLVHRTLLLDGSIKYLRKRAEVIRDEDGNAVSMRGTVHDVTDVYQISAKLTKTSRQLKTTVNAVEEGVWEFDLQKQELSTSPKFWDILGKPQPVSGNDFEQWLDCIVDQDRKDGLAFFNRFLKQKFSSVFQFEFRLKPDLQVNPTSKECWLKVKGSIVAKDDDGQPIRIAGIQRDITSSVEARRQLNRAQVVFDNTSECILITDRNNKIISVNRAFEETTGYRESELLGKSPNTLSSGIHDHTYYQSLWAHLQQHEHWKGEVWNRRKNGEIFPEEISINVIRDDNDAVINYVAVFRDISHWKQAEEQLTFYAYNDPLTGLVNRRSFIHRVSKHIETISDRRAQAFSLLFIDTDDFKTINDLYGHDFGDKVLVHIASCLRDVFPVQDDICRYGGDEFCILMPNTTATVARHWARQVVERVSTAFMIEDVEVNCTVSIGISAYPDCGVTHTELLKNADYAMYNMKGRGRNGICEYDGELQSKYIEKLKLRDRLKKAIIDNVLTVYYQPIVDAHSGEVRRFEALVRWFDDKYGFVSPADFIPIAEQYGLIRSLGAYVLQQACHDLKAIHDAGYPDVVFAINRSVKEFIHHNDLPKVWEKIEQYGLPVQSIIIEITESTASKESKYIQELLNSFKQREIKVALDDFGTGYSSLSAVVELRPDIIKIDRSFIREIEQSMDSRTLVSLIIDLSHKLGIQVVAEGVETRIQLDILRELNCQFVQGFYFSPAVPFDRCMAMLAEQ